MTATGLPEAQAILDSLLTFVAVLTPEGRVLYANRAPFTPADDAPQLLSGTPLWQAPGWRAKAVRNQLRRGCERAARGETVRDEVLTWAAGDQRVMVEVAIVPLIAADGTVRQLVMSAVDSTALRDAERALIDSERHKDEFLAMLAHELRNPLAPLRNAAALMRLADEGHAQRSTISELVERQVKHLSRLLDDLLDASRIDQGKIALTLERVELGGFLDQTLEATRPLTDARGHKVLLNKPERPVWMNADLVRLNQIIENLVANASKFTDPGGTIRVTLTATQHKAQLSVADNGHGIEAELLPRVFDLFVQGSRALDRSQGGLGIGLSLVRNLASMHGGTVTAHSQGPGHGAEFTLILPLLAQRLPQFHAAARAAAPVNAKRILVVDDNVDAAQSLAELLALKGHQTRAVTQSQAALELAPSFAPQVVLLDIGLPEIDGFQVARRLRQMSSTRNALIVAVTGYGQPEDRKATSAAGFDHHLVKPVSLKQLQELFDRQRSTPTQVGAGSRRSSGRAVQGPQRERAARGSGSVRS